MPYKKASSVQVSRSQPMKYSAFLQLPLGRCLTLYIFIITFSLSVYKSKMKISASAPAISDKPFIFIDMAANYKRGFPFRQNTRNLPKANYECFHLPLYLAQVTRFLPSFLERYSAVSALLISSVMVSPFSG